MISTLQAIILSIVQGITEWLPISSSGHLAIFQSIFGFQSLAFDVFLHFASILAVIILFWDDLLGLRKDFGYLIKILIAIIPIGIVGILFKDFIASTFSNTLYLGVFFMISGILVYSTKFSKEKKEKPTRLDSLFIGLFQVIALLPGISRSGTTISAGLFRSIKREEAVRFSFLTAIPIVLGASILELKDLSVSQIDPLTLIVSFIMTFAVSVLAIKLLLGIIKNRKFHWFGLYNLIIGLILVLFSLI